MVCVLVWCGTRSILDFSWELFGLELLFRLAGMIAIASLGRITANFDRTRHRENVNNSLSLIFSFTLWQVCSQTAVG
jgi:hypothetical protein